MSDQNPPSSRSVYPLPPGDAGYDAGYRYEDAAQAAAAAAAQSQETSLPIQPSGYEEHRVVPQTVQQTPTKSRNGGEVKPRLRKACDSCSVRKVKVSVRPILYFFAQSQQLTLDSVTKVVHHASLVPVSTSHALSTDPAGEEVLLIDMLKRSRDNGSMMAPTTPWLPLKWLPRQQEMPLSVLLL